MIRFQSSRIRDYGAAGFLALGLTVLGAVPLALHADAAATVTTQTTTTTPVPPPDSNTDAATAGSAVPTGPIENGKDLQPRGKPDAAGKAEADALLREHANSPASKTPPVIPRDLYGQPMDGAPDPTQIK